MIDTIFVILIIFGAVDLIALAAYLVLRFQYRARRKRVDHYGDRAEHLTQEYLHKHFPDAFLLNNLYFKTDRGLTQIDHILICRYGLYIIETKSHNGHITVGERNWTQRYKDKNVSFYSPVRQNQVHLHALKRVLAQDENFARYKIGLVCVFTSKNVSFSEPVRGVVRLNQLAGYIRKNPQVRNMNDAKGGLRVNTMQKLKTLILDNAEKSARKQIRHNNEIHNQYSENP